MIKSELRKKYKTQREQLDFSQAEERSLAIANRLLELNIWHKRYFHLFLSIAEQKEIDTEFILQILAGKDKDVILSKADFDTRHMTHFLLTDSTIIRKNNYNIPEPVDGIEVPVSKIDVVFVPLLAFDKTGHRVGYGKGFYDRFLLQCRADVIKVGLSFFEAEDLISDTNPEDIRLDFCVTPARIYKF